MASGTGLERLAAVEAKVERIEAAVEEVRRDVKTLLLYHNRVLFIGSVSVRAVAIFSLVVSFLSLATKVI